MVDGEKKFTVKDLYELYVVQNYCMDAISKITCIPLVPLSRIFQKYELPDMKKAYYNGRVTGEKTKVNDIPGAGENTLDVLNVSAEDMFFGL